MRPTIYCLLLIAICFFSCRPQSDHRHAFYYWKTTYYNDTSVVHSIDRLGANEFYIHYLDVDWSEAYHMPVPKGELRMNYTDCPFTADKYVPVVFITNRTLEQMPMEWCDTLAAKLTKRIATITEKLEEKYVQDHVRDVPAYRWVDSKGAEDSLQTMIRQLRTRATTEIQIDCDWTAGTKDKYFNFLRKFKALNTGKTISATVRLYPYKYPNKMGVPPVDRGMLMCYNMGKIKDGNTRNSILDIDEMKQYFNGKDYPLPLDIALPTFGWYAWFRGGKYKGIVHEDETFVADTVLFRKKGEHTYTIATDTVLADNYYREGDEFRQEQPTDADVQAAARLAIKYVPNYGTITFFDWNDHSIVTYEKAIQAVFAHR